MKLELKHLSAYLPYGLRLIYDETYNELLVGLTQDQVITDCDETYYGFVKPILRPLSDLFNQIDSNDVCFKPLQMLFELTSCEIEQEYIDLLYRNEKNIKEVDLDQAPWFVISNLFKWHFDVFGLIPAGLAIDINTLND